jgi:hypothetical protein
VLNRILDEIDKGLPDGNRYSNKPKAVERAAWRVVVKHLAAKGEDAAKKMIKTWITNGVLEERPYENPETRKEVLGLYVVASKRPGTTTREEYDPSMILSRDFGNE